MKAGAPSADIDGVVKGQGPWHAVEAEQALLDLEATVSGLSDAEASRRLAVMGPNLLQQVEGPSALRILWEQVRSPMLYVLIASGFLAIAMGKTIDGLVILGVVVVNALIGFLQEYRAGRAIRALMDIVPQTATVLRGGRRCVVRRRSWCPETLCSWSRATRSRRTSGSFRCARYGWMRRC